MVAQTDRRAIWHPRHPDKFAVGGGANISLYEWSKEEGNIRRAASYDDLQHMKCFAWSYAESFDDLFAVGFSNGKVDLIRMWESDRQADRNEILARAPLVSLAAKSPRSCNSITFSPTSPGLLACGMDKVRGDSSVVVWDINVTTSSSLRTSNKDARSSPPGNMAVVGLDSRPSIRYLFQAATGELVNAVCFASSSDRLLLAGVSGRFLRQYDLRAPKSPAPAFSVPCKAQQISADALDDHRIACCGDGIVTVWDVRHMGEPALTFTAADGAGDVRRARGDSASPIVLAEFSRTRRGLLATLERDGNHVRFWDLQVAPRERNDALTTPRSQHRETSQTRVSRLSWTNPLAMLGGSGTGHSELTPVPESEPHINRSILANTWKTKSFAKTLASFALVPVLPERAGTTHALVINKEGDMEVTAVHDAPKQVLWSTAGDLLIGNGRHQHLVNAAQSRADGLHAVDMDIVPPSPVPSDSSFDGGASPDSSSGKDAERRVHQVISSDISLVMRMRAERSYAVQDMVLNAAICAGDDGGEKTLSELWTWLEHTQQLLGTPEAKTLGFDFALQGLIGIWEGLPFLGPAPTPNAYTPSPLPASASASPLMSQRTLVDGESLNLTPSPSLLSFPSAHPPHRSSSLQGRRNKPPRRAISPSGATYGNYQDAVIAILTRQPLAGHEKEKHTPAWRPAVRTDKMAQRRLALALSGWNAGQENPSLSTKNWEDRGDISKAACWLVFLGNHKKAVEVLIKSKDETHFMLSGSLAAFSSLNAASSRHTELRDHCRRLIPRLADPYLRALFTRLAGDEWTDVLDEPALPLRERLAIALHFLDDASLTTYFRRTAEECRAAGEIEGLLLTGLVVSGGVDILQAWLDRTGDIQTTATLAARMPLDARVERWIDSYRDLLDGWRMYHERAEFDIARGDLLRQFERTVSNISSTWAPKTVVLRCNYCSKTLDSPEASYIGRPTVCPNCKRQLPRCSVCLLNIRVIPDGARAAEAARAHPSEECDEPLVICQTCRHGGHASHILGWFFDDVGERAHKICPVTDCPCACADEM